MESSGLTLDGLPDSALDRNGPADDTPDPDVERMGPPDDDPGATRWSAGAALPASTSKPDLPEGQGSPTDLPRALLRGAPLELVRGERDGRSRWTRSDFRLAADPDVEAGPPTLQNTPALHDTSARMNADRRRRFVDEPTQPYQMPDPAAFEPGPTPPELLTPPDFVSAPTPAPPALDAKPRTLEKPELEPTPPASETPATPPLPLALAFSVDADDVPVVIAAETPPAAPPPTPTPTPTSTSASLAEPTTLLPLLPPPFSPNAAESPARPAPPAATPPPPRTPATAPLRTQPPATAPSQPAATTSAQALTTAPTTAPQRPLNALLQPETDLDPIESDPSGPFGGARDYRQAVADRLPRAIRLLMPPPVPPPDSLTRTQAIESGRRRSDVELQVQAHRAGRDALAAETRADELAHQATTARDQAYEARATWQWTAHRRTTLADELQQITTEANTVVEEQRRLSEQAGGAMRDVAAWEDWIGQLREESTRLAAGGQSAEAESANSRADHGQSQANQLRDWLDRAEQRFRQLGAHLQALAGERDNRVNESIELAARQHGLVERYQQLGNDAQRLEREAAGCAAEAIGFRLECREQLIDLVGLRPELCRWVNGAAVAQVQDYDVSPGYRRPLQAEHDALEQVLPRTPGGEFEKAPEPTHAWISRINGVGLLADQSRAQNSVDATLAFYDAYVLARPRVALPRAVDAHRSGTTRPPLRGETTRRLEEALGGSLRVLYPAADDVRSRSESPGASSAFESVAEQLRSAGHGAFAVLVTGWPDGNAHASAVVNYQGTVRWVDPQLGVVSQMPVPAEWVRSVQVLLVDGAGKAR